MPKNSVPTTTIERVESSDDEGEINRPGPSNVKVKGTSIEKEKVPKVLSQEMRLALLKVGINPDASINSGTQQGKISQF